MNASTEAYFESLVRDQDDLTPDERDAYNAYEYTITNGYSTLTVDPELLIDDCSVSELIRTLRYASVDEFVLVNNGRRFSQDLQNFMRYGDAIEERPLLFGKTGMLIAID